jgi:stress response protein YsnF
MKEEAKQQLLLTEFDNLNEVQEVLRETMKKLKEGSIDIGKARVIKEVACAAVDVARTKFVLLKTLSASRDESRLIIQSDVCEPVMLPEEVVLEATH